MRGQWFARFCAKVLFLPVLALVPVAIPIASVNAQSAPTINVWWPADGSTIAGVQPFKAVLSDARSIDTYRITWQVDGGNQNDMPTNVQDSPHKEASVDVTNWSWQTSGRYGLTFTATGNGGAVIATKSMTVTVNAGVTSSSVSSSSIASSSSSLSSATPSSVSSSSISSAASSSSVTSTSSAVQSALAVWWPVSGVTLAGTQPFKVAIVGASLSAYTATWSVDGGAQNTMQNSQQDAPHKEAVADVSPWNWKGSGPYTVTFRALDKEKHVIGEQSVVVYTPNASASSSSSMSSTSSAAAGSVSSAVTGSDPLSGLAFYVDQQSNAATQAASWQTSRPSDAALMQKMAGQPEAQWLGGWNANVGSDVSATMNAAAKAGTVPTFVVYNIPGRDCGGYSGGGTQDASSYASWIRSIASSIGSAHAAVILEPDALAQIDCLSSVDQQNRMQMLTNAVKTLKANHNTSVYLDAGHANWISAPDMASRLQKADMADADGFALNVSNFDTDAASSNYGSAISALIGGKHFVVDTSRNGLGPTSDNQWCNPSGRALGRAPTTVTGNALIDAYLWIKHPGESDGSCNGGPSAGTWWADQAVSLAKNAGW